MVLGPLEVRDGERVVRLGSAKQRLLLGALLVHANQVVSVDRLADILWADDQPADPTAAVTAGLVTDDGERVELTDPAAGRALVDRGSGRRRQRRHASIAEPLAAGSPEPGDSIEIAELLVRAGRAADPVLVARHTRTAGDIALAAGAWEDARCYYEAALERADAES
jgi:hypothetical protein